MKIIKTIFAEKNNSRGSMLVELLLSIALAALVIPFVFKYHQDSVIRAQNIAIANQMTEIQVALERYIIANRTELLKTVGRNITRVDIADLADFGIPQSILQDDQSKYQLRILKSSDLGDQSTLQGIIVRESNDISPMRTREIVNLSGGNMGFVDGNQAYGTFGAWHTASVDLGVDMDNGIVETTSVNRDNALYLWRLPSANPEDARMQSALNLGGHDIRNAKFVNAAYAEFNEGLSATDIASDQVIFQNRTTIDNVYSTMNATVAGGMSADSKNMEISGTLSLADVAKMSSLTTQNLWVSNMTLAGISIDATDDLAMLKINQSLDMTSGHIDAMYVTVGFAGSITPRLDVSDKIIDSVNEEYYWDVENKHANFADASFVELNRMAALATYYEGDASTISGQIFGAVSANKNATVSDYMNAIREIQKKVESKYRQLNLE